jgi:hypothetical protein
MIATIGETTFNTGAQAPFNTGSGQSILKGSFIEGPFDQYWVRLSCVSVSFSHFLLSFLFPTTSQSPS